MIISLNSAFVSVAEMSPIYGRQITVRLHKSLLLPKHYVTWNQATSITWFVCTFFTHAAWDLYSWCCEQKQPVLSLNYSWNKSIWTFKPHLKRLNVSALDNKITEQMTSAAQAFLFTKADFLYPLLFYLMQYLTQVIVS